MRQKFNLYGIGNDEVFNFYIFDKKQSVAEKLSEIFYRVFKLGWNLYDEFEDKKGKWKHKKINFEKKREVSQNFGKITNNLRVDIFYGNKKMFVAVRCPQKLRLNFNEELFKIAKIPKTKK